MPRINAAVFALVLLSALFAAADTFDPYYDLIYDYEVASFCGLVRTPVHEAYAEKRARLEAASGLDEDALTDIRVGAMADAGERRGIPGLLGSSSARAPARGPPQKRPRRDEQLPGEGATNVFFLPR